MDKIDLNLDEDNELLFRVTIEGANEPPTAIRFVCEDGDMAYMFKGFPGEERGEIYVNVPQMSKHLKEGEYESRLEVLIEGKYISPLQLLSNFKQSVKVVAEAIQRPKPRAPEIKVTASIPTLKERVAKKREEEQKTPLAARLDEKLMRKVTSSTKK